MTKGITNWNLSLYEHLPHVYSLDIFLVNWNMLGSLLLLLIASLGLQQLSESVEGFLIIEENLFWRNSKLTDYLQDATFVNCWFFFIHN